MPIIEFVYPDVWGELAGPCPFEVGDHVKLRLDAPISINARERGYYNGAICQVRRVEGWPTIVVKGPNGVPPGELPGGYFIPLSPLELLALQAE